jgi:hypothetical protein
MTFRDLISKVKPAEDQEIPKLASLELSKVEIEILLNALADATFTGRQLETLYKLIIKLQTEHRKL